MRCPKCYELLLPGSKKCGDCGWKEKTAPQKPVDDHKCEWRNGQLCCPALGSLSDSIKGGGPWYCRWHYFNRDDLPYCIKITEDMIRNGVPKQKNWCDEVMDDALKTNPRDAVKRLREKVTQ